MHTFATNCFCCSPVISSWMYFAKSNGVYSSLSLFAWPRALCMGNLSHSPLSLSSLLADTMCGCWIGAAIDTLTDTKNCLLLKLSIGISPSMTLFNMIYLLSSTSYWTKLVHVSEAATFSPSKMRSFSSLQWKCLCCECSYGGDWWMCLLAIDCEEPSLWRSCPSSTGTWM